jgi:hypothetical protein
VYSARFNLPVVITLHAEKRMLERSISREMLIDIIDTGTTKYRDETHLWVYKHYQDRSDNLICAVLVLEHSVVVKTVMHHFTVSE